MWLAKFALRRPYTIAAMTALVCLFGVFSARRTPTDIFPEINIPVVSVVWSYNGMVAREIQARIIDQHERQLASLVDDIARIESNSYNGVGVIKVYLHEGASISAAVSQITSSALTVLKYMPRNITPPLVVRYSATDVPIIQLSLASDTLPDVKLNDYGQNVIRPYLATVQGAQVPFPYGGKPRLIMADLDNDALRAKNLTPNDVTQALLDQNLILPTGTAKIGDIEYAIQLNNSTDAIEAMNDFPVKRVGGAMVFLRDVAHVHNGYQVQTNSVSVNGVAGSLMIIRKTGGVSTLRIIDDVLAALPDVRLLLPEGMTIKPIFNQAVFVKAALRSVEMGGLMAAVLTGLMILLFLGNWRLTSIILVSLPLSMLAAVIVMYAIGETFNVMTLGGFALAVGILVDNATVVIENVERHLSLKNDLEDSIVRGAHEVGFPTMVSTLAICIVFFPIFLLQGTSKYLFSPLAVSVVTALLASLLISFTLVPLLFKILMKKYARGHDVQHAAVAHAHPGRGPGAEALGLQAPSNSYVPSDHAFNRHFVAFRGGYRHYLAWSVHHPVACALLFVGAAGLSCLLFPRIGMDFFPTVDAGQMRLHVRAPDGTRLEKTQQLFARVEGAIREIVGRDEVDVLLDNIGLPYSGINIALSDTATAGPMDGEILISLKEKHRPTAEHMAALRRELPKRFPEMQFFFQPADIIKQVLNFGQPSPIDIRVQGAKEAADLEVARKIERDLRRIPGVVDVHLFQVPAAPALGISVDRVMAQQTDMTQGDVARNVLLSLSSSAVVLPNFWINPRNQISYLLVVQTPQYKVTSVADVQRLPLTGGARGDQMLMNVADVSRTQVPMLISEANIIPVFDVNADVEARDLSGAAADIDRVLNADRPPEGSGIKVSLAGQVETMRVSFAGIAGGMAFAIVLVYLLMVINFQSWLDPLIVLMAVPCALAGVAWMLYLTRTHLSVPALMGTLMCIGLTTANSILVVVFARQRLAAGDDSVTAAVAAGYTRIRPVLMTAGAMILGMIPMSLGIGEGGEQNAPLARAVIGGLLFATFATLIFVPSVFRLLHGSPQNDPPSEGSGL
ncbi:MAG: efflux RND transporter permease subunit [Candidatus Brocadiia bacterium]|jgi:multidrug efflux pump subunit AcrB